MSARFGGTFGKRMNPQQRANVEPWQRLQGEVLAALTKYSQATKRTVNAVDFHCITSQDEEGAMRDYQYYGFTTTEEAG